MAVKKVPKGIKFEEALQKLEATVAALESGELPLDEAIEEFQYGTELSKACLAKLNLAKAQVEKLNLEAAGRDEVETEPLEEFQQEGLSNEELPDDLEGNGNHGTGF